jgi:hypothetical protein
LQSDIHGNIGETARHRRTDLLGRNENAA